MRTRGETMHWSLLFFGFLLGVRHALEADHVVAVASLASRTASVAGLLRLAGSWGLGHALAVLALGSLVIALGATIPPTWEVGFERVVGLMLIALGAQVLWRIWSRRVHVHVHQHGDHQHFHLHAHPAGEVAGHDHQHSGRGFATALLVGSVHGVAGSAALLLIALPRATSGADAVAGLAAFGIGSILGMLLFSLALSVPLRISLSMRRGATSFEGLLGLLTIAFGAHILIG